MADVVKLLMVLMKSSEIETPRLSMHSNFTMDARFAGQIELRVNVFLETKYPEQELVSSMSRTLVDFRRPSKKPLMCKATVPV